MQRRPQVSCFVPRVYGAFSTSAINWNVSGRDGQHLHVRLRNWRITRINENGSKNEQNKQDWIGHCRQITIYVETGDLVCQKR